jgi:PAS domain-containing protein
LTATHRPEHDRRGVDRPANGDRQTCAACSAIARFDECYAVARRGVTLREPAWVCMQCGGEVFVRRGAAQSAAGLERRALRSAARAARFAEMHALRQTMVEIHERARARHERPASAHRRAQALIDRVARNGLVSILAADERARVLDANTAACALIGVPRQMLLTMTVRDLFTADPPRFDRAWERFLDNGQFEGACRLRQRSGVLVTVACFANAHVSPGIHIGTLASRRLLQSLGTDPPSPSPTH